MPVAEAAVAEAVRPGVIREQSQNSRVGCAFRACLLTHSRISQCPPLAGPTRPMISFSRSCRTSRSIVRSVRPDFAFSSGIVISGRFRITASNFAVVADIFPELFPELPLPPKTLSIGLRQIVVTNPSR